MRSGGLTAKTGGLIVLGLLVAVGGGVVLLTSGDRIQVEGAERQMITIDSITDEQWQKLAGKRVFFGHKSVGYNILEGVDDIVRENPKIQLKIFDLERSQSIDQPGIYHKQIGRNTRPLSKLKAFRKEMESSADRPFDIALMKFCYVDLVDGDDPEALFEQYQTTMSEVENLFPETTIIHSTVPIEAVNPNLKRVVKERIKSLIGRPGVVEKNWVRQRYNDSLRATYEAGAWVFDIALAEASAPDGTVSFTTRESQKVFLMDGRYSTDGGHLNDVGRRRVAEQFLVVLAMAANGSAPPASP
jgi:hypothetical protein